MMTNPLVLSTVAAAMVLVFSACAVTPDTLSIKDTPTRLMEGTILRTDTATAVDREQLMAELAAVRITYVGERHTDPSHHAIQLEIIEALHEKVPELRIGMEMFDHTYQPVLDRWTAGELDEDAFLRLTHWYANWRFDFGLYRDILNFAKQNQLRVIALNVPAHITRKIGVGGVDSLSVEDRGHLPETIDTSDAEHRAYIEEIYAIHTLRGRDNFAYFYEAQCTWEDAMAEAVAEHIGESKMVVLVGNGHIIRKFGIPNRAFARKPLAFKTVYLATVGSEAELSWADYLWVTPKPQTEMSAK